MTAKVRCIALLAFSLISCQSRQNNQNLSQTKGFEVKGSAGEKGGAGGSVLILPWPNYSSDFANKFLATLQKEKPNFIDTVINSKEGRFGTLSSEDLCWYGKEFKDNSGQLSDKIRATYMDSSETLSTAFPVPCEDLMKGMFANKTLKPLAKTIEERAKQAKVHVCTFLTLGLVPGLANYAVSRLKELDKGAQK